MKKEDREALAEVNGILENTEEQVRNKIPKNFTKFVKENMDETYEVKIDRNKSLVEQNIKKETKEILALIYRDYLCSKEERETLILQEQKEMEKKQQEQCNINFYEIAKKRKQKRNRKNLDTEKEATLINISEEKWHQKIRNKILKIFSIK